ncbi:MAG: terminase small subunit [Nitrospirota bacterium]
MIEAQLTPKQQRFVQEYAVDLNGTQAAIRAGYSPKTARSIASENLQRPAVKQAIKTALRTGTERLQKLTAIAFADSGAVFRKDPKLGLVVTPDPNIIQSIRRYTRTDPKTGLTRKTLSIKFVDPTPAILELGRRLGIG